MSRVHELIKREILRAEKNIVIFRLFVCLAGYVGTTLWLNAIRQASALWFVWILIGLQFFFLISIFVVCSMRARQCGHRHPYIWLLPILFLSRVENWELVVLPALVVIILIISERNQQVSSERQHLLPEEDNDADG